MVRMAGKITLIREARQLFFNFQLTFYRIFLIKKDRLPDYFLISNLPFFMPDLLRNIAIKTAY
jgi:hypothetical protein